MISVSDILKLLEKIPVWKDLVALPAKVKRLEDRVAQLESDPEAKGDTCPYCEQQTLKLLEIKEDGPFGDLGGQKWVYKCSNCDKPYEKSVDSYSS